MRQSVIYNSTARISPEPVLDPVDKAILEVLAYFDIFNYPLLPEEICNFSNILVDEKTVATRLIDLTVTGRITQLNGFYSLQNNPLLVHRRREGNARAEKLLVKARRIGRFLHRFPFVKAVCISGSLSKHFALQHDDIDFFIITKANRLWLARTFMHLFKKFTFLTGKQHYFCMNYYVDEEALEIPEKNIFTAVDINTLLPVSGTDTIAAFFDANGWTRQFHPKASLSAQQQPDRPAGLVKRSIEWILGGRTGLTLERFSFRITKKRWARKQRNEKRNDKGARMSLLSGPHFAKSNPGDFQEKVLALFQQKISSVTHHR